MNKKFIAGIILGGLFLYLSLRNIDFDQVLSLLAALEFFSLAAASLIIVLVQYLRARRWGVILSPLNKIKPGELIVITNIGLLAVVALPARVGEIYRAYLATKSGGGGLTFSSALATILVERVLDGLTVILMAGLLLFFLPFPDWLLNSALTFSVVIIALLLLIWLLATRGQTLLPLLAPAKKIISEKAVTTISAMVGNFLAGFKILVQERKLLAAAGLSALIWLLNVTVVFLLFSGLKIPAPLLASFTLIIIITVGIAIPAAPGFIGNWHYATILGLGLFGIPETEALAFAVIHHFLSVGLVVLLGLVCLPFNPASWGEVKTRLQEGKVG